MAKDLIVYYSRSGNTEAAAKCIQEQTGGDLFRVETVKPYAPDYKECCAEAVAEWKSGARPEIREFVEEMERYDRVYVCYPLWCGTMPMCLFTLLEHYDLTGKKLSPLCTHEGSGFANSLKELQRSCPGAHVCTGLEIRGSKVAELPGQIRDWVRENAE